MARTDSRDTPGIVVAGASPHLFPDLSSGREWLHADTLARVPRRLANRLLGRRFSSFGAFRTAFWKEVGKDPLLAMAFDADDRERMQRDGRAPRVPWDLTRQGSKRASAAHAAALAGDPDLRRIPLPGNAGVLLSSSAPVQLTDGYQLHHLRPIHAGGGVYDLSNIVIVTPLYHARGHLLPALHYRRA